MATILLMKIAVSAYGQSNTMANGFTFIPQFIFFIQTMRVVLNDDVYPIKILPKLMEARIPEYLYVYGWHLFSRLSVPTVVDSQSLGPA